MTNGNLASRTQGLSEQYDARLVFLIRAAARYDLYEIGEIELDEAIAGLVPAFQSIWKDAV
jgi:hypothetical protein